jgi:hypothetical protein
VHLLILIALLLLISKNVFSSDLCPLVLKKNLAETVDEVEWYRHFINAVLQLQRMTALDSAAERGESTNIIEEQLGAEKFGIFQLGTFGFSFSEAIEFFQNLEKGNEAQERIKALRIKEMKFQEKNPGGIEI